MQKLKPFAWSMIRVRSESVKTSGAGMSLFFW